MAAVPADSPAITLPSLDPTVAAPPAGSDPAVAPVDSRPWTADARYFEYTRAANPIASGHTSPVPMGRFDADLYADGPTRVVPLDQAAELGISDGPATSPGLLASFVRIVAGEEVTTAPNATSELYYVLFGSGSSTVDGESIGWEQGDVLTLPARSRSTHRADTDTGFYWVTDEPLLRRLGVTATERRFAPTKYPRAETVAELARIAAQPNANSRNRVSVLLANAGEDQTLTITHVLWAMLGLLPAGEVQAPHRHQSVALDLILDCQPGCYTLVGDRLDPAGAISRPTRIDWRPGGAFVTPPGKWHAHHNESGVAAHLLPVQDAGLQTYLRALDIRFGKGSSEPRLSASQ